MPSLLLITPTLGHSQWLEMTIYSVQMVGISYEHIIVCPNVAFESVSKIAGSAKVVVEPDGIFGMYSAINFGIKSATSDWDVFCYVNDDDYLLPDFKNIPFTEIAGRNLIYYGKSYVVNESGTELFTGSYLPIGSGVPYLVNSGVMPFFQVSMIIPISVFKNLGFFDPKYKYCGDFDFVCRAVKYGIKFKHIDLYLGAFRINAGQLSSCLEKMESERKLAINRNNSKNAGFVYIIYQAILLLFYRAWNISFLVQRISRFGGLRSESIFFTTKKK